MLKRLTNNNVFFVLIFILGLVVRFKYANLLPVTNDEGAYLYDTLNIRNGLIPLKDFLTKSLPFIYLLNLSQVIFGNSLLAGRLMISLISLVSTYYLYLLTRELVNKKAALIAAAFYWSFPLIAAYTTLIHTEPMQTMLTLSSYYYLICYMRNKKNIKLILLSGFLIGVAFFVRQSSITTIVWPFVFGLILYFKKMGATYLRTGFLYGLTAAAVMLTITMFWYVKLGLHRTMEFIGVGAVNLSVSQKTALSLREIITYPATFLNEFSLESSNLFRDGQILFVFFMMFFVYFLRSFLIKSSTSRIRLNNIYLITTFGFLILFQSKYNLYTGQWKVDSITHLIFTSLTLLVVTPYLIGAFGRKSLSQKMELSKFSPHFVIGWVVSLFVVYLSWIKFRSPYLIEFFPPMIILASTAATLFYEDILLIRDKLTRRYAKLFFAAAIVISLCGSYMFNKSVYFTGLHMIYDLKAAKDYLSQRSKGDDEILTASAIFPYLSGDHVTHAISHPAWYGYPSIKRETLLLYFPPFEDIISSVAAGRPKFVIRDSFTDASYFKNSALKAELNKQYTHVKTIGRASIYLRSSDLNEKDEIQLVK